MDAAQAREEDQSQEIEVLGTEFNVKAYNDESNIFTTLVEGQITVDNYNIIQNKHSGAVFILSIAPGSKLSVP